MTCNQTVFHRWARYNPRHIFPTIGFSSSLHKGVQGEHKRSRTNRSCRCLPWAWTAQESYESRKFCKSCEENVCGAAREIEWIDWFLSWIIFAFAKLQVFFILVSKALQNFKNFDLFSKSRLSSRQSRRHGGTLVGLAPPNKAPSPPKLKYETL